MAETLSIFKTYNCRIDGGTVKRGRILDDWLRYGVYYGTPEYLQIHDFDNWNILVFDYDVLEQGVDPSDYGDTDIYIYIAFGGEFNKAARKGGYYPPDYNTSECAALRETVHREIDAVIDAGFAGIFWDECDTGFWDWSYSLESSNILKDQLQEYCNYVRTKGGKSFINGCPWFANCAENFMLESFMSTWSGNLFAPDWAQNDFFIKYEFGLEELGEAGGIPWTTGIYAWLYTHKYAPDTIIYAHSYGSPDNIWQHDKQKFSLAAALALGLQSWNYIDPTNQSLIPLWAHSFYVGAPLECPQIDVGNKCATRKYTGASVSFDERSSLGTIDMNIEPDYWWNIDRAFKDINWDIDGTQIIGTNRQGGFVPDYLKIEHAYFYDDHKEVYFRVRTIDTFPEADIIPFFLYIQLDPLIDGYRIAKTVDEIPYLYFENFRAQLYLYGKSIFYWDQDTSSWQFLYSARYEIDGNYLYYAIRKETLKFAMPTWDETNIRIIPLFIYEGGNSFFVDDANASYNSCLTESALDYTPEYLWVCEPDPPHSWENIPTQIQLRPYPNCSMPFLGEVDEASYNQVRTTEIQISELWDADSYEDVTVHSYTCSYNFTIYGYALCQCEMKDDIYIPHSAVIYSVSGQINKKITQVNITGNFGKAWIFDRENGRFVGPDDTPNTYFTSSPFSPTKIIDGQDIYVAIANDSTAATLDTWSISAVSATLVDWTETYNPGYDIALPTLIKWQDVYEQWKEMVLIDTLENIYLPAGIKRGGISLKKDSIKGTFTVTVPSSGAIVDALEIYDITNAKLLMRRTYEDLDKTDPDNTELLILAYVDSWELSDAELRIRAKLNFHNWGAVFPKRRASYFCPFVFKGPACNYGGSALTCDKTLTTCTSLGNEDNFGGIPTLPRLQRGRWG